MMQKIFRAQKVTAGIYFLMSIAVFVYTLVFMTEYKDLFGLKLQQNSQISFFHDSILQTFNKQIFTFAIVGILIIVFSFLLEIFSKVPDLFAVIVLVALLAVCCGGAGYALNNLVILEAFYKNLDFQYLYLEGLPDYEMHFTTFRAGLGVYVLQIAVCAVYGITIIMSHVTFRKNEKKGRME